MTYKRYMIERNLTGFATVCWVSKENGLYLILDQTWFHPQGGGQQSDVGSIEDKKVIRVVNEDGEIKHYIEQLDYLNFEIGQQVRLEVDKVVREQNSKLHTGGHLIAAVVEEIYPNLKAVGGHHWKGEARVEFWSENLPDTNDFAENIICEIKRVVTDNIPVSVIYDEEDERSVKIGNFQPVGCGGTHIQNLSEITDIKITKVKVKSGKLRVSYQT